VIGGWDERWAIAHALSGSRIPLDPTDEQELIPTGWCCLTRGLPISNPCY